MKLTITIEHEEGGTVTSVTPVTSTWPEALLTMLGVLRAAGYVIPYTCDSLIEEMPYTDETECEKCKEKNGQD
jgi:hypothetical protein